MILHTSSLGYGLGDGVLTCWFPLDRNARVTTTKATGAKKKKSSPTKKRLVKGKKRRVRLRPMLLCGIPTASCTTLAKSQMDGTLDTDAGTDVHPLVAAKKDPSPLLKLKGGKGGLGVKKVVRRRVGKVVWVARRILKR